MSSFRRPKSEAALRLYSLPRRELQALCKQYGIPANKTNVAMADALSACVPANNVKPKASAGSSLGVAKTTPMKLKLEKKVGLPETSLASFILTGKRKASPTKVAEQPTEVGDGGFPKLNTTPLKRGVKKPVQAVQEEKSKVTAVPAFTRALQDRIGKVSSAQAVSSPKPPVPTPRKRAAEAAAVVTRRGGDALPPVSFYDLVFSPEKRLVHEIIDINSTAKTANKRRTRLAHKTEQQEEESALPLSHAAGAENKVSKGKRVVFADEVEPLKTTSPEPEPQAEPESEPETETIEVSYAEIEFKDAAIHKELFGFQRNTTTDLEQDVALLSKEDLENREDALDSTKETEIEFRDRALQQELFRAFERSDPCEELVGPTLDLQQAGTSASAVELESQERRSFDTATSYPAESLIDSNNLPVQDHSVLSSICEDACEGSDRQGQALEDPTEQNLAQGSDPRALPNDVSCDDLGENLCEKGPEVPDHSHASSLECAPAEVQSDCRFTLQQEPTLISSSADAHVAIDDVKGLEDTEHELENEDVVMLVGGKVQQHQSENQEVVMLVDGNTEQQQSENNDVVMLVDGDTEQKQLENPEVVMPVGDDIQEHQSENHEVMVVDADIKHGLSENHEVMVVDADIKHGLSENHEVVMPVGDDIQEHQSENHEVMVVDADIKHGLSENHDIVEGLCDELLTKQCPEESFFSSVPVPDEAQEAQSISSLKSDDVQRSSQLDEKEKIETPRNVASAKGLVAVGPELVMVSPSSPSIPVTPAMNAQNNSTKRLSGPASSNISTTPVAVAQVHSAKRLSGPGIFNVPVTPVPKAQESSSKRMSDLRNANVPVTPAANAQDNSAKRKRSSNISVTPPTNAHHDSAKLFSVPSSASIPVTPVTKLRDNSDSALAKAATPLTKIQSNIDSTLAKATSILEKLAAWRADAEKKVREGYWEPKFSTGVESSSAPDVERPLAKLVLAVDRDVLSAKKARPASKPVLGSEKPLTVCEDTDIVSKGDMPSAKKMRTSDETKDSLEVSDKENQSDKSIDSDKSFRKMGGLGKDKKKGKKFEVLKDRSKNLPDHGTGLAPIKEKTGLIRPGDMSLRKLRAQVKQKVSQLETSKASPLRPQKAWNSAH